jgi:low affinity Fe/Cu permease
MDEIFRNIATKVSGWVGSWGAFITALLVICGWLISGPLFNFSNTWQLVINTTTTIITFLMVFLIQYTQNRDSKALHLKLDELLKGVRGARDGMVDIENQPDEELDRLQNEFKVMHVKYSDELNKRRKKD